MTTPSKPAVVLATRIYAQMFGKATTDEDDVRRMRVLAIAFENAASDAVADEQARCIADAEHCGESYDAFTATMIADRIRARGTK